MSARLLTLAMLIVGGVLALTHAQQPTKIPRIGFVAPQGRSLPLFDAFQKGLADVGYVDGKNIVLESRFAEGQYERFPGIFAELVRFKDRKSTRLNSSHSQI